MAYQVTIQNQNPEGFFPGSFVSRQDKMQHVWLVSASQHGKELEGGTLVGRECVWQW